MRGPGRRARRLEDVRQDNIIFIAVLLLLVGVPLAGASFLATDGPPWPFGVLGVALAVPAAALLVARIREIWSDRW